MTTHPTALETALKEFDDKFVDHSIECSMDNSHGRVLKHAKCYLKDSDYSEVEPFLTSFATTLLSEARAKTMVEELNVRGSVFLNGVDVASYKRQGYTEALTAVSNRWDERYPNSK